MVSIWPPIKNLAAGRRHVLVAVLDQAVVSGGTFATMVFLGRFASTEAIGVYTLAFSLMVVLVAIQQASVITPYTVFAHRAELEEKRQLRACARLQSLVLGVSSVVLILMIGGLGMHSGWLTQRELVWAMSLATPAIVAREYGRMMASADLRFGRALAIDATAVGMQLVLLAGLAWNDSLDAARALYVSAITNGIVGVAGLLFTTTEHHFVWQSAKEFLRKNWRFGFWVTLAQIAHTAQNYIIHWVLLFSLGLTATGIYGACWSVVMLVGPFVRGIGNAFEPKVAQAFAQQGARGAWQTVEQATWLLSAGMLCYLSVIALLGGRITVWMYGIAYSGQHWLVTLLAGGMAAFSIGIGASKGLAVLERPSQNFVLNFAGLAICGATTAALAGSLGLIAAGWGYFCCGISVSLARWWQYSRATRLAALQAEGC